MPVVPFSRQPDQSQTPQVDDVYLLMAAAQMHQQGRLFEPEPVDTANTEPKNKK